MNIPAPMLEALRAGRALLLRHPVARVHFFAPADRVRQACEDTRGSLYGFATVPNALAIQLHFRIANDNRADRRLRLVPDAPGKLPEPSQGPQR